MLVSQVLSFRLKKQTSNNIVLISVLYFNNFWHKSFECLQFKKLPYFHWKFLQFFNFKYKAELDPQHVPTSEMKIFVTKAILVAVRSPRYTRVPQLVYDTWLLLLACIWFWICLHGHICSFFPCDFSNYSKIFWFL